MGSVPGRPGSSPGTRRAGRQMYQSRLASSLEEREARNHSCSSLVWLTTRSITRRMPRA